MKRLKIYILSAAMALGASACLDKYPEDAILANQAITTVEQADQAVIGIYSSFLSSALYSGYLTLLPDLQADLAYAINGYTNTYGDISHLRKMFLEAISRETGAPVYLLDPMVTGDGSLTAYEDVMVRNLHTLLEALEK